MDYSLLDKKIIKLDTIISILSIVCFIISMILFIIVNSSLRLLFLMFGFVSIIMFINALINISKVNDNKKIRKYKLNMKLLKKMNAYKSL